MQKLEGKVALVTGAARGIGAGIATAMVREGCAVLLTDIDGDGAEEQADAIRREGGQAIACAHDVTNPGAWQVAIALATAQLGPLDILVNNAGILLVRPIVDTSLDAFRRVQSINVDGVFLGIQAAFAAMGERGGAIVNVASVAAIIGAADQIAYGASKGAVRIMTKCAALEAAKLGYPIRCNTVLPGGIDTPMTQESYGFGSGVERAYIRSIPSGRLGTPDDIAKAVIYLASDDASYVNGTDLIIDGASTVGFFHRKDRS